MPGLMLRADKPLDRQRSRCVSAGLSPSPGCLVWGGHCQSSALSPQTGNVSAVIDVKSGHVVGSLKVGRYGGEQHRGVAGDRGEVGRCWGQGPGAEGMCWGWRERDLHGH